MSVGVLLPATNSFPVSMRWIFIGIGGVLCLTIIGIIPAIIPFSVAAMTKKKLCPVCENNVLLFRGTSAFNCFYCHQRILEKKGKLVAVKNLK